MWQWDSPKRGLVSFSLKKVMTSISHLVILLSSPTIMPFSPPFQLLIPTNSPNSIWIMKMQQSLKTSDQTIVSFCFCASPFNWLQNSFLLIMTKSSVRWVFLYVRLTVTTNPCPSVATWGTVGYIYTERESLVINESITQGQMFYCFVFCINTQNALSPHQAVIDLVSSSVSFNLFTSSFMCV